ncbi:unnamed protein product, partial [Iphiclides podalirius]
MEGRYRVQQNDLLLHEAVIKNEPAAVKEALLRPTDVNCRNNYGRAPIHWAASRGNVEIIKLLIEAKCDIEAVDKKQNDLLQCACAKGSVDVAAYAISLGAKVQGCDAAGDAPLALAARSGHTSVVELLLENGAEIDAINKTGRTALHVACEGGHSDTAVLLVSKGAAREASDNSGRTPLHIAAVHRHTELVRTLLETSCHVDATDNNGVTALQMACAQGCRGIVEHLLAFGADVHLQNNVGSSALHAACAADAADIVELLLVHGADPAVTDKWSQSPMSVAGGAAETPPEGFRRAARGSFSAILDLLTATANVDIHQQHNSDGSTSPRAEEKSGGRSPAPNEDVASDERLRSLQGAVLQGGTSPPAGRSAREAVRMRQLHVAPKLLQRAMRQAPGTAHLIPMYAELQTVYRKRNVTIICLCNLHPKPC